MKYLIVFLFFIIMTNSNCQIYKTEAIDSSLFSYNLFSASLNDTVSCYRIPAMVTAPNGDLIVAIDQRVESCNDLNSNKNINIVIRRSLDNGNNWMPIETIVDYPFGKSASDPSMIVDKISNQIFLFYNYMDLENQPGIYYLHVISSDDNGKTWNKPQDITPKITLNAWKKDFKFITSGRGIQTSSGVLMHTLVNLNKGLYVFGSKDHGKSWFVINTPIKPADESKLVELSNGAWMINSRVSGSGLRYIHTSIDSGKTWTTREDSTLIDPGCNASIIRYSKIENDSEKTYLLFSNANDSEKRKNMSIKVSADEGESWSAGKTIYSGNSAYSSLTILKNGEIGLLFEKDDYTENVFVRFPFNWLTN
ncbi:MAG: exo-alpha-sialidase [Ignavibacteriales bacterium]|nr:exo-alpha-sialidase [Ignavibacteriales bacterium]